MLAETKRRACGKARTLVTVCVLLVVAGCGTSSSNGSAGGADDWLEQLGNAQRACNLMNDMTALNKQQSASGESSEATFQALDSSIQAVYLSFDELLQIDPTLKKSIGSEPEFFYQLRDAALAESGADMEMLTKAWTFAPKLCEYTDRYGPVYQGS